MSALPPSNPSRAVAVYCASSLGNQDAFSKAAICMLLSIFSLSLSLLLNYGERNWWWWCEVVDWGWLTRCAYIALGAALARDDRPVVYGGGSKGIMGVVSGTLTFYEKYLLLSPPPLFFKKKNSNQEYMIVFRECTWTWWGSDGVSIM